MNNNNCNKMKDWGTMDLQIWLESAEFPNPELKLKMIKKAYTGQEFMDMLSSAAEFTFQEFTRKQRNEIRKRMESQDQTPQDVDICDNIYGTIKLHPLLHAFVQTTQFSRLRAIKQLGTASYVYNGAKGDRFQHCIGTGHLARVLLETMKSNNELNWTICNIDGKDMLCVMIAALLHDIGHGPWSHFWDGVLIKNKMKDGKLIDPHTHEPLEEWTHELASNRIIDDIYNNDPHVEAMCKDYGIGPKDIEFIKELIDPQGLKGLSDGAAWPMSGRGEEKAFLYEIVSNQRSGLDVDKLDYLKRDLRYCKGADPNIDYIRLFQNMKVEFCPGNGNRTLISIRDKCDTDVMEVFKLREKNHREIYQHPDNISVELMIGEAIQLVLEEFKITGAGGKEFKLHECCFDMTAYCQLNEEFIFQQILHPGMIIGNFPEEAQKRWHQARDILLKVQCGKIWPHVGHAKFSTEREFKIMDEILENEENVRKEIVKRTNVRLKENQSTDKVELHELIISKGPNYDWGMKDEDPIRKVAFHTKAEECSIGRRAKDVQATAPSTNLEKGIRVYLTNPAFQNEVKKAFEDLCKRKDIATRCTSQGIGATTPLKPDSRKRKLSENSASAADPAKRNLFD